MYLIISIIQRNGWNVRIVNIITEVCKYAYDHRNTLNVLRSNTCSAFP